MKKFLMLALLMLFAAVSPAVAELATVDASIGSEDVYEINNATPGTSKTFLGTRLRGPLQAGSTTVSSSTYNGGGNTLTAATATYLISTSASQGSSVSLANGYQNQEVTFVLTTDGGKDFKATPSTKTGLTDVALNDAGDTVTLKYINDTVGWIVSGNNGSTVNQ